MGRFILIHKFLHRLAAQKITMMLLKCILSLAALGTQLWQVAALDPDYKIEKRNGAHLLVRGVK
jgi:hypothetical protein